MKKRLLSLAIALALCLGLAVPAAAGEIDSWNNDQGLFAAQYEQSKPVYKSGHTSGTEWQTGFYYIMKNGLLGVITPDGSVIIPINYYHIEYLDIGPGYFKCSNTHNSKAWPGLWPDYAPIGCMWALYDTDGNQILPMEYQELKKLEDGSDLLIAKQNDQWGVINLKGQVIVPLVYEAVTGRYENSFVVTAYREGYKERPKDDEPYKVGDLWKHQGVVGIGGKVLIDFEKYQTISVDSNGRFKCGVWTGGYVVTGYMGSKNNMQPLYGNEYTYEYIDYKDLNVSDDVSSITAPTTPSTPTNPAVPTTTSFSDVPANAYYAAPVAWAVSNNITNGTRTTAFSPDRTCTTAEILTFLYRACGEPYQSWDANPYTNVSSNDYCFQAALWAANMGMVSGSTFLSGTPCSRASAVKFIWQAMGSPAPATTARFSDVAGNASYAQAVSWAVGAGVTNGTSSTTFSPNDTCTRGQIVTFLYRAANA